MNKTALRRFETALVKSIGEGSTLPITKVKAIGPFDNAGHSGLLRTFEIEENCDFTKSYQGRDGILSWVDMPEYDGVSNEYLDLGQYIPSSNFSVVFIAATIESDRDQVSRLSLELSAMGHIWLNGQKIIQPLIPRQCNMEEDTLFVSLKKGKNDLLIKAHYGDEFPLWLLKWACVSYGDIDKLCEKISALTTHNDKMISLTAKYTLTEIYAAFNMNEKVKEAAQLIIKDEVSTDWDKKWVESLFIQKEYTGSYQPLRDVQRLYEPAEGIMPCETLWPQVPKTNKEIYILDVNEESAPIEFACKVLQGLTNRENPSLYIVHRTGQAEWDYKKQDLKWIEELQYEGFKTSNITLDEAWNKYKHHVKGAVIYDASIMDEIGEYRSHQLNQTLILMMIASLEDAIPVTPEMNEKLGLPVLFDARGKWSSQFEMMNYAYRELYPRMNHTILATQYPGKFFLTDYLVAFKIFTFWFPEHRTLPEENLLNGILASTPPNTPIIGWWFDWMPNCKDENHRNADALQELYGLLHGSFFGKILTPSHEATNLTIHSGVPLMNVKHKKPKPIDFDESKIYYTYVISDGDNLGEALMMRTRDLHWDKKERGLVPMGWTVAPSAAVMAPTVLNYYLRTVTENDLLIGGLGIGYTEPTIYTRGFGEKRAELFNEYGRKTDKAMEPLDTNALWLISGIDEDVNVYAKNAGNIKGIFVGYGGGPEIATSREISHGVTMFRPATVNLEYVNKTREEYIQIMADNIREAAAKGEKTIEAWVLNWSYSMDMLQEVSEQLGEDFVCVRPDVLIQIARKGTSKL